MKRNELNTNDHMTNNLPLMLQAYYDNELEENEKVQLQNSLTDTDKNTLKALQEITELTKFENESATETINPYDLLRNIRKNISSPTKNTESFTLFKRKLLPILIPSFIATVALLTLIPTLILYNAKSTTPIEKEKTIVIMDASGSFVNPQAVSYTASQAPVIWYSGTQPTTTILEKNIDQQIEQINNRLNDLEQIPNKIGTPKDTKSAKEQTEVKQIQIDPNQIPDKI